MTIEQQLKHYITHLFTLPKDEIWNCESVDETADDILPEAICKTWSINQQNTSYVYLLF